MRSSVGVMAGLAAPWLMAPRPPDPDKLEAVSRQILEDASQLTALDLLAALDAQNRVTRSVGAVLHASTTCSSPRRSVNYPPRTGRWSTTTRTTRRAVGCSPCTRMGRSPPCSTSPANPRSACLSRTATTGCRSAFRSLLPMPGKTCCSPLPRSSSTPCRGATASPRASPVTGTARQSARDDRRSRVGAPVRRAANADIGSRVGCGTGRRGRRDSLQTTSAHAHPS